MPNFRWSPQAKTITDMRRRDCNLPLICQMIGKTLVLVLRFGFVIFRNRQLACFDCNLLGAMGNSTYGQNDPLKNEIQHHSEKKRLRMSKTAKMGC